jgi:hypothetical protein
MAEILISEDSGPDDLAPIALALNELLRLPVTMRSARSPGVQVETAKVIDERYSGPILEKVLTSGNPIRTIPDSGTYKGVPVAVAPLKDKNGMVIAAIGIVDVIGTIDFADVFGAYPEVVKQVTEWR